MNDIYNHLVIFELVLSYIYEPEESDILYEHSSISLIEDLCELNSNLGSYVSIIFNLSILFFMF